MNSNTRETGLFNLIQSFLSNPCIYVAAVIGTLPGIVIGAAVGVFSGGFIGDAHSIFSNSEMKFTLINPNIILGLVLGLFIGGALGGIFTGTVTMFKIHKKTYPVLKLDNENINGVALSSLYFSIEMAIGMGLGAIIGSLKTPGIGTVFGALAGSVLMLYTGSLEKFKKRKVSVD